MKNIDNYINNIGEAFFEFQSKLQFFEREFLKHYDIVDVTPNEVKILYIIGTSNTKSMSDIASQLKVTKGTLSIAVNSLVKKGYVIRTRHKQDRRVIIVYLTKKSIKIVKHYSKFYYTLIAKLIEKFDPERMVHLTETIEELNRILDTNFYQGLEMDDVSDDEVPVISEDENEFEDE